ncbi:hypothetical protein [Hymenobacter ginsengisoli]|uniref:hypothetical protein n=1 Tax=Hymenobacter ginsengisoli TaxID=1051626 RepID=UPI0031EB1C1A
MLHQVVTHKILVAVHQDWVTGRVAADAEPAQVGVIALDIRNNVIPPLPANLATGSVWTGFRAMVQLGIGTLPKAPTTCCFYWCCCRPHCCRPRCWRPGGAGEASAGCATACTTCC